MRSDLILAVGLAAAVLRGFAAGPPVLEYSLRFGGSREHKVASVAVARDGSVYVAGSTTSDDFPKTGRTPSGVSERSPDVFVTRLAPDGASIMCSVVFGGASDEAVNSMTLGPGGAVYVLGYTVSPDFPVTAGSAPAGWSRFLVKVDPCEGGILYSTVLLPGAASTGGLAVDSAGNAVVAFPLSGAPAPAGTVPLEADAQGVVLRVDPAGNRVAAAGIRTEPTAVAIGLDGSVYVAGQDAGSSPGLFVAKLASGLGSAGYIRRVGSGRILPSAVAVDNNGNAYVTGGTSGRAGFPVTKDAAFPEPTSNDGILLKLDSSGGVVYASFTDPPGEGSDQRRGVGLALDRNGKVHVAVEGNHRLPDVGPLPARVALAGARIRVFQPDGSAGEGGVLVPSSSTFGVSSPFGFGLDGEGRAALATVQSAAPVTPGGLSGGGSQPVSVVMFDYGNEFAPELQTDVEVLNFTVISAAENQAEGRIKTVNVAVSDGSLVPFSVAVVPEPASGQPQRFFSAPDQAATPGALSIIAPEFPHRTAAVIAAAGLRGGFRVVPLSSALVYASLSARLDSPLDIAAPSAEPLIRRVSVEGQALAQFGAVKVSVPFQVEADAPWLKADRDAGVTPAEIVLTADPSGRPEGVYPGRLILRWREGSVITVDARLTIGSVLRLSGAPVRITLAAGSAAATIPMKLTSSGAPLEFRAQSQNDWLAVTPTSGTTPADLVLTLNPARMPQRDNSGSFVVEGPNANRILASLTAVVLPVSTPSGTSLSLSPAVLAPGGVISIRGMLACAEAEAALPWPADLSGSVVRVNGTPVPIGRAYSSLISAGTAFFPICGLSAQLPYELAGTAATIEVTTKDATIRTAQPVPVAASAPQILTGSVVTLPAAWLSREDGSWSDRENPVRIGEVVSLRISGYGRTEPTAPLGDVGSGDLPVRPVARIEAFIGARRAEVVSAELSRSEVGVAVVRVRVPEIQPDDHWFVLRVAGVETGQVPLRVVR